MPKKKRNTGLPKITQLPSGAYHANVYAGTDANGKRIYRSFTNYDYAALVLELAQFKSDKHQDKIDTVTGKKSMTVGEGIDAYIQSKSTVLSPSTVRSYKAVRKSCLQMLMSVRISELTREDVQIAVNQDAACLSPKSVRNAHGLLTAMLSVYRPDFSLHTTLPQKVKPLIEIPTEDEINLLLEMSQDTEMYLPILLGACCGMRRSEISALTWECINFDAGTLTIRQAAVMDENNQLITKGTKTIAGTRTIRLLPIVAEALREQYQNAFPQPFDQVSIHPDLISHRFAKLVKKANIHHFRFHDLRHYTVSVMLSLNIPKNYIADYVGHETENMIDRVYGHIMAQKKTSVEDQLQAYFSTAFARPK